MASHLVVAEHKDGKLSNATLSAIAAAAKVGGDIQGLVLGQGTSAVADQLAKYVSKVHHAEHAGLAARLAQPWAKVIADAANACGATHVWAAATAAGKDILPRVAARLDAAMASDICGVVDESSFKRPMWAGNIIGTVELKTAKKVISVRPTEFEPASEKGGGSVVAFAADPGASKMRFVSFDEVKSDRPQLTDAQASSCRAVVASRRPARATSQADRAAGRRARCRHRCLAARSCDAGWVPNDLQVGQTGKVVAPEALHRRGHLGRHPARRRHEGFEDHRRHQQGSGGADLPDRRLRPRR
jgi:electron transfer flavoprotein alpha subunit